MWGSPMIFVSAGEGAAIPIWPVDNDENKQ